MARRASKRRSFLRHRSLIAIEAMLVMGLAKDVLGSRVKSSELPSYAKVLFIMAMTIGLFGGLFVILERMSSRGVAKAHEVAQSLPLPFAYWLAHAGLFIALYFLYAYMNGLRAF
jgi:hypothetical protein